MFCRANVLVLHHVLGEHGRETRWRDVGASSCYHDSFRCGLAVDTGVFERVQCAVNVAFHVVRLRVEPCHELFVCHFPVLSDISFVLASRSDLASMCRDY